MSAAWFRVANEAEIASPALVLFSGRIDENIRQMIALAGDPARLRPHVKTHKLSPLVERQIALGIVKFKCATIAEAEMTAAAGAREVLLAYPCVGPNAARLCLLAQKFPATRFAAVADDPGAARALGELAVPAGVTLDVFIDLDCGMHRTGIEPGPRAIELWRVITQTPGLRAAGLHAYDGHIHDPDLVTRRAQCDAAFAPVLELRHFLGDVPLIAGGSPTFALHAEHPDRELSPGTTVLWDFSYADKFPELPFQPAAVLLTRIVSCPGPGRLCLDLGYKAVASENPHPRVRLLELPDATAVMHSEEHLVIETPRADEFAIGDCLHGIPRHVCPTVALHDSAHVVEAGRVRGSWPILARARSLTI
jgi:D-serine deaminase-like pyridoxal phosphate-dependent protein